MSPKKNTKPTNNIPASDVEAVELGNVALSPLEELEWSGNAVEVEPPKPPVEPKPGDDFQDILDDTSDAETVTPGPCICPVHGAVHHMDKIDLEVVFLAFERVGIGRITATRALMDIVMNPPKEVEPEMSVRRTSLWELLMQPE